jgi:dipeptidase D
MGKSNLEPKIVFDCFAEVNQIPRPSNKEDRMMAFLVNYGKKLGLESQTDETGNVLIRKPASKGYEKLATTVIQSHMDMVCEKVAGLDFDFEKDAIQTEIEGEWMRAKGTTLGADDGIGVAMEMALLADDSIKHGPIECLFTRAEETSLGGASGLKAGFMTGKYLLNLDSEDEGQIFISCAGGANTEAYFDVEFEDAPADSFFFKMQIKGLVGGHSGDDIEKKRANANILLARLLYQMMKKYGVRLSDIQSGGLHNAIPRDGYAVCCVPMKFKENVRVDFNTMTSEFEEEYAVTERTMEFELESVPASETVMKKSTTDNLIKSLVAVQNGVFAMSQDIDNFVETSSNLASVRLKGSVIYIETMQRSNLTSKRLAACDAVRSTFELAGARTEVNTGYPGWHLDPSSPLLKITVDAYERLFGHKPIVRAIHAGLECGLFSEKYPDMDMVSFGPTLRGVHSPDERLLIPTVKMVWDHLQEVLKNIPQQ